MRPQTGLKQAHRAPRSWLHSDHRWMTLLSGYSETVLAFAKGHRDAPAQPCNPALLPLSFSPAVIVFRPPSSLVCGQPPLRRTTFLQQPGLQWPPEGRSLVFLTLPGKWAPAPAPSRHPPDEEAQALKLTQLHSASSSLFFQEEGAQCRLFMTLQQ